MYNTETIKNYNIFIGYKLYFMNTFTKNAACYK